MKNAITITKRSLLSLAALALCATPALADHYTIKAGSTDQTVYVFIPHGDSEVDLSSAYYVRTGGSTSQFLSTELAADNSPHSDGKHFMIAGFIGTLWRIDLPDAAVATGTRSVNVVLIDEGDNAGNVTIDLVGYDPTDGNRLGLAYLPNAAPGSTNGLLTYGTGTGQLAANGGRTNADVLYWNGTAGTFSSGRPDVNASHAGGTAWGSSAITANSVSAGAANKIVQADKRLLLSTTVSSGVSTTEFDITPPANLYDSSLLNSMCLIFDFNSKPQVRYVTAYNATTGRVTLDSPLEATTSASWVVEFFAAPKQLARVVKALPNSDPNANGGLPILQGTNLNYTVATVTNVTSGVSLADEAITSGKFDQSTAFPVTSADTGSTALARAGADSDTLKSLSDQIDGIGGDPWSTALPGPYATGTAGQKLSGLFDFLDDAPTFGEAMDEHGYYTARAEKIDKLAPSLLVSTTISVLTSQTTFTLAAGPPDDDALNGALVVITRDGTPAQKAVALAKNYDQATKTLTLVTDPEIFDFAAGDTVDVIASGSPAALWLGGSP